MRVEMVGLGIIAENLRCVERWTVRATQRDCAQRGKHAAESAYRISR